MEAETTTDAVLAAVASARPQLDEEFASPTTPAATALRDRIMAAEAAGPTVKAGVRWQVAASAAAALVMAVVAVATSLDSGRPRPHSTSQAAVELSSDSIRRIAAVSSSTLSGTGKADVVFSLDPGALNEQTGSGTLTFAGDNLEMLFRFDGREGRPGFEAMNRTVDGRFYLLDGPPEDRRWYVDTNAPESRGSDLFTVDPRTMVSAIEPEVEFVLAGREDVGGVQLRHLRATRPSGISALNLGFGPIETTTIENFDVWVDDADVVRRLDISTTSAETRPASATKVVGEDGRTTVITSGEMETVESRASYSVRFYAIGEPIQIEAPAEAIPVAGQG